MLKTLKANTLLYVLIMVNIALIMGVVVYNGTITISNNLSIGNNNEEIYKNIYNKGNIALQSVAKFNSNGNGFTDIISCPTNVTMSGSTYKVTGIVTQMAYDHGTIFCKGTYRGDEFRIFFNIEKTDYDSAYYKGDLVKLKYDTSPGTPNYTLDTSNNIGPNSDVSGYPTMPMLGANQNGDEDYAVDNNLTTQYKSYRGHWPVYIKSYIKFTFPSSENIGRIIIKKKHKRNYSENKNKYTSRISVDFYDDSGNKVQPTKIITGYKNKTSITINVPNGKTKKTKEIILKSKINNVYINVLDVYMYKYVASGGGGTPIRVGERKFNDSDNTLISFDNQGTGGGDKIDDNMNSDDYKGGSINDGGIYINYPFGYEDDDVTPRKTFWGNVQVGAKYYNIFWNNYKTDEFIENNPYNNIGYSEKIGNVGTGYIYLDTYNTSNTGSSIFDLKIIQFDKQAYKNQNTLLPIKSWEGKGIDNLVGYIQLSSTGNLSLSYYKTGNEFPFNFKDKDYAIFITNKNDIGDISYILTAETESGTGIYINPINDSLSGTIEVMANHMLMGGEKNFIGENFVVVGPK